MVGIQHICVTLYTKQNKIKSTDWASWQLIKYELYIRVSHTPMTDFGT